MTEAERVKGLEDIVRGIYGDQHPLLKGAEGTEYPKHMADGTLVADKDAESAWKKANPPSKSSK